MKRTKQAVLLELPKTRCPVTKTKICRHAIDRGRLDGLINEHVTPTSPRLKVQFIAFRGVTPKWPWGYIIGLGLGLSLLVLFLGIKVNDEILQTPGVGEMASMSKPSICIPSSSELSRFIYDAELKKTIAPWVFAYPTLAKSDRVVVLERKFTRVKPLSKKANLNAA
jgi:hypothetical protein